MRIALTLGFALIAVAPRLQAQTPTPPTPAAATGNTTAGTVTRVILLRIKDGQTNAFWDDVRRHGKVIYDEEKKQGIILDYSYFTKSTSEGPSDWDVGMTITFPNWASFDTFGARVAPVTLAHYGTADARTAAGNARNAYAELKQNYLIRQQTPNPIAK